MHLQIDYFYHKMQYTRVAHGGFVCTCAYRAKHFKNYLTVCQ